jgi:hypothetical protein
MLLMAASAGCRHRAATTRPAPAPAAKFDIKTFADRDHGFSTSVPAKWAAKQDPQNVLTLDGPNDAQLSIAVPKLPAHIPGFIPLPPVQSGYVDDLRKRLTDVKASPGENVPFTGGTARRFEASGVEAKAGATRKLSVLLITRGDHLYIVTGEAPAAEFSKVRDIVDSVATSWTWMK